MRFVGESVSRVEDKRILTGRGRYIDDVRLPRMLHATFLRSPFAHARITSIDTAAAKELPGVFAIFTGADIEAVTNPIQVMPGFPDFRSPVYRPCPPTGSGSWATRWRSWWPRAAMWRRTPWS